MNTLLLEIPLDHRNRLRIRNPGIATMLVLLLFSGFATNAADSAGGNSGQDLRPGFVPKNALTLRITLPKGRYSKPQQQTDFYNRVIQRIDRLPGIKSVGAISNLPLDERASKRSLLTSDGDGSAPEGKYAAIYQVITPEYFRAMGIPLLKGRMFTDADTDKSPAVAIINESIARLCFPDSDPVGKRIRFATQQSQNTWLVIIGVTGDTQQSGSAIGSMLEVFVPYAQNPRRSMSLVVRTTFEPLNMAQAVQEVIHASDEEVSISDIATLEKVVSDAASRRHAN